MAIKNGQIPLQYDTGFIYSEVNGPVMNWTVNRDGSQTLDYVNYDKVGRKISTKAIGSSEKEDITHLYKHNEGKFNGIWSLFSFCFYCVVCMYTFFYSWWPIRFQTRLLYNIVQCQHKYSIIHYSSRTVCLGSKLERDATDRAISFGTRKSYESLGKKQIGDFVMELNMTEKAIIGDPITVILVFCY